MRYSLFLDDVRDPPDPENWVVCRSSDEAIQTMTDRGIPNRISFDHDLGGSDTAMIFVHEMIEQILDGELSLPGDFSYRVHSANPVGRDNLIGLLDSFLKEIA